MNAPFKRSNEEGTPSGEEAKLNFDILKYDIEHYLSKHKHYENTYYLIMGISAVLIFFFLYPYASLVWTTGGIDTIKVQINNVRETIDNIEYKIANQTNELPPLYPLHDSLRKLKNGLDEAYYKNKFLINQSSPVNPFEEGISKRQNEIDKYSHSKIFEPKAISKETILNITNRTEILMNTISNYNKDIIDDLTNKSSKIVTLIENSETFFGKIPINFFNLLYLFPAGMGIIAFILIFRFKDLISFQKVMKKNYMPIKIGLISNSWNYTRFRHPSLFDVESPVNFCIVLAIPIVIFIISVIINIHLIYLLSSISISGLDIYISSLSIIVGLIMILISLRYAIAEYRKSYLSSSYEYKS